mgnify:FL=1
MIIPDDFYKLTLEHFAKTYPGLTLFAVWESKTVNGILETRVHLFDVERDEKLPIYTVSIHPRDLIFALLGETMCIPYMRFQQFLDRLDGKELPYPPANY